MKKLLKLFVSIVAISTLCNADFIKDKTVAQISLSYKDNNPSFSVERNAVKCKNHVLYYVSRTTHGHSTLSLTFNPETRDPFYCLVSEPVLKVMDGVFSENELYVYTLVVFYNYAEIKDFKIKNNYK